MSRNLLQELVAEKGKTYSAEAVFAQVKKVGIYPVIGCIDPKYSAWMYFLSFTENGRALVFETGLGIDTLAVAPHAKQTVAICPGRKIAEVVRSRIAREAGGENITVIVARPGDIPFAGESFDLIVSRSFSEDFESGGGWVVYQQFIEEVKHLLTVDGQALLGTDYYALWEVKQYLKGIFKYRNEWICSIIMAIKYWNNRELFCCMSDHYLFDEIIVRTKNYQRQNPDNSLRELIKNTVVTFLFPFGSSSVNYIIRKTDRKFPDSSSLFQRILAAFPTLPGREWQKLTVQRVLLGNPGTILCCVTIGKDSFILRIPLDRDALLRAKQQVATLNALRGDQFKKMGVPGVFPPYSVADQLVFVEEKLDGVVVEDKKFLKQVYEDKAIDWIINFHLITRSDASTGVSQLKKELKTALDTLAGRVRNRQDAALVQQLKEKILHAYDNVVTCTVCMHGDYKIENTMFSSDLKIIVGVFDWDLSNLHGFPLVDVYYFIAYSAYLRDYSTTIADLLSDTFVSDCLSGHEEKWVDRYMAALEMNREYRQYYITITWLYHVVYRVPALQFSNPAFYAASVHSALERLSRVVFTPGEVTG
jgi:aminoglycoside phosphotransferase (APT) family kinase protein